MVCPEKDTVEDEIKAWDDAIKFSRKVQAILAEEIVKKLDKEIMDLGGKHGLS
jgi:hypothetical protein